MSFPLVSVVIPAFNAADFIESTVLSALAQTYQNLEILVIDDGSTDDTQEALDQFAGQVRYHKRPNGGPAAARNTGIEAAGGKYVAFLDADDRWKPEKITKQVASLEELGNAFALSHTDVVTVCDERELLQTEKNLQPFMPPSIAFERLFSSNFIATSSVVCRKEVFEKLGGFDESRGLFAVEDYDMWLRVASHYGLAFDSERLLEYRVHSGGISRSVDRSYQNERNILDKWYGANQEAVKNLSFKKNRRYQSLMLEWGQDLAWNGREEDAKTIYMQSLAKYGLSRQAVFQLLKLKVRGLIQAS